MHKLWMAMGVLFALVLQAACIPISGKMAQIEVTSGELAAVKQSGVIVIATDPAYPPQSELLKGVAHAADSRCDMTQYSANQLAGFDVDVGDEIARRLGVEPCFVTPTWSEIVAGSWGDRWDISVGSMVITPERMQRLYFTQPYISGAAVLFVHKDNKTYKQLADLSGKRVGVCTGCAYEAYLRGTLSIPGEKIDLVIKNAKIVGYDTDTSALADLAVGDGARLDGVLTDPDTGETAIKSGLPIKRLGGIVYHDYSGIALDKSSSNDPVPLLEKITAIVQDMHRDGTLLKLSQKYYGGDFTTPAARFNIDALRQVP